MGLAAALLALLVAPGPLEKRSIGANATADVLIDRAIRLGIDFDPANREKGAPHPTPEDVDALGKAGAGAWLEAQLSVPDASVGDVPADLRRFLDERQEPLDAILSALERDPPEWNEKLKDDRPSPNLYPTVQLQRVLLARSLVAIRDGDAPHAERHLEASFALARPLTESRLLIFQIMAVAASRWQAGVLRKLPVAPPAWIGRLSDDQTWSAMLDAFAFDAGPKASESGLLASSSDPEDEVYRKAPGAVAAGLKRLAPCEGAALDQNGLWKLVERELSPAVSAAKAQEAYREISLLNVLNAFRRAARLTVDRELTLEILRLRQSKDQDREGRWPTRMESAASSACPAVSYAYRSDGAAMEIRFDGTLTDPESAFLLPLVFRDGRAAGGAIITPKPAPSRTPTPGKPDPDEQPAR
jgi:hypothetical protein